MSLSPHHLPTASLVPSSFVVPSLIANAGANASHRCLEFFAASISNPGTRAAYAQAVNQFCRFCTANGVELHQVTPIVVAGYLQQARRELCDPTVKLHLSALRMLFDYLVLGHIIAINPAASVRGPKHVVKVGKTPVLDRSDARRLLDSIETDTIIGLRDRALIGVMIFSFARISAALGMNIGDFYPQGRQMWFRLHEKGGKFHEVPAHRQAVEYLDDYLAATQRQNSPKLPLFCSISRQGTLTESRLHRSDALKMVKARAAAIGLPTTIRCHTFRATGITAYLENGGSLEHAQRIAAHESARTTRLYDRSSDALSVDEIHRTRL
jgi:site-specific recombinase XerC